MSPVDVTDDQALEVCDRCSIDWHEWGIENAKEVIANSFNVISETLPPTEDPRVLRRALEIACSRTDLHSGFDPFGECLDAAIMELESEAAS